MIANRVNDVASAETGQRPLRPVVGPGLRRLLHPVFGLFALLGVNGVYLAAVTGLEWWSGQRYQDYFYQLMFLGHLTLGLLLLVPFVVFGALHLRNAWPRPNRRAVRAGVALFSSGLVLVISGLVLTRLGGFEVRDPEVRSVAYWVHLVAPAVVIWLFLLHRLAGRAIRWRLGLQWAVLAVLLCAALLLIEKPAPGPDMVGRASYAGDGFRPSLAKTAGSGLIPPRALMMDDYCAKCHADVHAGWKYSAHRFSSFNNPAYRFSVRELRDQALQRDGNTLVARFCAGCHDLVPLFSGAFDDPRYDDINDPTASAGITCTGCHAITGIDSLRGNADYTIEAPEHYPFAFSESPFLQWVNRQLVKAKPEFHKRTYLKPLHRTPEFCGSCHKVFLPEQLNGYKWLRGQNHYDSFLLSGVSGHGASSFYYPPKAVEKCAQCHMPLQGSGDFGARYFDGSGELKVHGHQFPAANTALPKLLGMPAEVNQAHQAFLTGALRVDIFGVKQDGAITGALTGPIRPEVPDLQGGQTYLLEMVIRTLKLGHLFTQGTADSNEVWVSVEVYDDDRLIGRSGGMGKDGEVDPWSHFINAYLLDRQGNRIDRRNAQDIFTPLYNHQIPPGAADVVHYRLRLAEGTRGPIRVRVNVNYRKFDARYLRYFQGEAFRGNDLPVTVLASDQVVFPVTGSPISLEPQESPIQIWERWNDYGIGLLRKEQRGELRQAEAAFRQVEALGRGDGALNIARVYFREGRLDDAVASLERAAVAEVPPAPWVASWLSGLINKQNGFLDQATAEFERVLTTAFPEARRRGFDFSRDYRVIGELGQTLVERAKQERGPARRVQREELLDQARERFRQVLALDPENLTAHYNLAFIYRLLGEPEAAEEHARLHDRYRPDDNAGDRVIALHRSHNPAANHAAEAIVIYDLQRTGAYGLPLGEPAAGPKVVQRVSAEQPEH